MVSKNTIKSKSLPGNNYLRIYFSYHPTLVIK